MSDPKKNFMCSRCGTIFNDTQRQWGKESICPVCRDRERYGKTEQKRQTVWYLVDIKGKE